MAQLPIILKVVRRESGCATVATESGHRFPMPAGVAPETAEEGAFAFEPSRLSGADMDGARAAMCRALVNEMIGAPAAAADNHEKTGGKIR